MKTLGEGLLEAVNRHPGETDRYLTNLLFDRQRHQSQINQEARLLESRGRLLRKRRSDGRIGNYPVVHLTHFGKLRKNVLRLVERLR